MTSGLMKKKNFSWTFCLISEDYPKSIIPIAVSCFIAFFVGLWGFGLIGAFFWTFMMLVSMINCFLKFDYLIEENCLKIGYLKNIVKKDLTLFKAAHIHPKGLYLSPTEKRSFYGSMKGIWIYLPSSQEDRKAVIKLISEKLN